MHSMSLPISRSWSYWRKAVSPNIIFVIRKITQHLIFLVFILKYLRWFKFTLWTFENCLTVVEVKIVLKLGTSQFGKNWVLNYLAGIFLNASTLNAVLSITIDKKLNIYKNFFRWITRIAWKLTKDRKRTKSRQSQRLEFHSAHFIQHLSSNDVKCVVT